MPQKRVMKDAQCMAAPRVALKKAMLHSLSWQTAAFQCHGSGKEEVHCRYIHADASKALQGRYDLPDTHILPIRGWGK
jgi:hypothetical protein